MTIPAKKRRSQAERNATTRRLLLEAAVTVLNRDGYNGATTAVIADEAGVSRGSIIYHFETRARLMTEVLSFVSEAEQRKYDELRQIGYTRASPADWPDMLWHVNGTPAGMAVIEILLATRSDQQLADLVRPAIRHLEGVATERVLKMFPTLTPAQASGASRLFLWAIRGLVIAKGLASNAQDIEDSLAVFRFLVEKALAGAPLETGFWPGETELPGDVST